MQYVGILAVGGARKSLGPRPDWGAASLRRNRLDPQNGAGFALGIDTNRTETRALLSLPPRLPQPRGSESRSVPDIVTSNSTLCRPATWAVIMTMCLAGRGRYLPRQSTPPKGVTVAHRARQEADSGSLGPTATTDPYDREWVGIASRRDYVNLALSGECNRNVISAPLCAPARGRIVGTR